MGKMLFELTAGQIVTLLLLGLTFVWAMPHVLAGVGVRHTDRSLGPQGYRTYHESHRLALIVGRIGALLAAAATAWVIAAILSLV